MKTKMPRHLDSNPAPGRREVLSKQQTPWFKLLPWHPNFRRTNATVPNKRINNWAPPAADGIAGPR